MADGSGSTLDSIFSLGSEYVRARYARKPDPALTGAQAVAIPAETVAQGPSSSGSGGSLAQYVPVLAAVLVGALLLGIVLKKAG